MVAHCNSCLFYTTDFQGPNTPRNKDGLPTSEYLFARRLDVDEIKRRVEEKVFQLSNPMI